MTKIRNPFVTTGYVSDEYFCDRKSESKRLIQEMIDGNNLVLISTRRMGKTGLIQHCFHKKEIHKKYHTFFIDIYASKSLRDFTFSLSKVIVEGLKSSGKKALQDFWNTVKSLQAGISLDIHGNPVFQLGLGDIHSPETTLDEIFRYLSAADKPCLIAIDEFQQISSYPEKNTEAILRTYIQHCPNAHFIFAGSQRHTMGNIFLSPARPFYQSVSMMHLESIPIKEYSIFAKHHFEAGQKQITGETIAAIYKQFEGITWYMQKMLHVLYNMTIPGTTCHQEMIPEAILNILESYQYAYSEILFRLPEKQKELLIAIAKEGRATSVTSGNFIKKHSLASASSVQAGIKGLLEKDFITQEQGSYRIYDRFLNIWLVENY